MSFSPFPKTWHTHFSWQLRLALKMLSASKWPSFAICLPNSTRSLIFWSHWLISVSSTCKKCCINIKVSQPKPFWNYKWSPTPRRCRNLSSHSTVAEDSILQGCYIMSGGIVPRIERNCRDCTQTTTQYHIPEERDLLSQRKCMAYHTIPLHKHKKVMVNKSYHYLQRQNLRYKWMIMICRDRPSGTNGWSWSAETDHQVQMDDHDLQRQTLRCKWMIIISTDRTSGTNGWSLSAQTEPQVQMYYHDLQKDPQVQMDDHSFIHSRSAETNP